MNTNNGKQIGVSGQFQQERALTEPTSAKYLTPESIAAADAAAAAEKAVDRAPFVVTTKSRITDVLSRANNALRGVFEEPAAKKPAAVAKPAAAEQPEAKAPNPLEEAVLRRLDTLDKTIINLGTRFSLAYDTADFRRALPTIGLEEAAKNGRIGLTIVDETTGGMFPLSLDMQKAAYSVTVFNEDKSNINPEAFDAALLEVTTDVVADQKRINAPGVNANQPYVGDKPYKALKKLMPKLPF